MTVFVPVQVYTTHLNEGFFKIFKLMMIISNIFITNGFQLPTLNLPERQVLFVSEALNPGKFFGQFEFVGTEKPLSVGLEEMSTEMKEAYSKLDNPPKLYHTTEQSLLGYYGVKHDATFGKLSKSFIGNIFIVNLKLSFFLDIYNRVRIIQEDGPVVKLLLVDHGSTEFARRDTVLAPISSLIPFSQPPYGIFCFFEEFTNFPVNRWTSIIESTWLTVEIGQPQDGLYPVTFAGECVNGIVAQKLQKYQGELGLLELPNSSKVK